MNKDNTLKQFFKQTANIIFASVLGCGIALANKAPTTRDLVIEQIAISALKPDAQAFEVTSAVNHESREYRIGDLIEFNVTSSEDAYITLVDVGTSGQVTILFPNEFQQANRVMAGETTTIPSGNADFKIRVGGPTGVELIKILATRGPTPIFDPTEYVGHGPFRVLNKKAPALTRDLIIELEEIHDDNWAEYEQVIRILHKEDNDQTATEPAVDPVVEEKQVEVVEATPTEATEVVVSDVKKDSSLEPEITQTSSDNLDTANKDTITTEGNLSLEVEVETEVKVENSTMNDENEPTDELQQATREPITINLTTDKLIYAVGETVSIYAETSENCELTILAVNTAGSTNELFSGQLHQIDSVDAKTAVKLSTTLQGDTGISSFVGVCGFKEGSVLSGNYKEWASVKEVANILAGTNVVTGFGLSSVLVTN